MGPGDRVVEVGAGLGSLTLALAAAGAQVRAIEFDRALLPALEEVVGDLPAVHVLHADAMRIDWSTELSDGPWAMVANLPYNIAVPLMLDVIEGAPSVRSLTVMVQKEVGERLVAPPGTEAYGAVSVRVAYRCRSTLVRRVPPDVFWPRPKVASLVLRLDRLSAPAVDADPERLWRVVDAGFEQRRKTMRSALRRLGLDAPRAEAILVWCDVPPNVRAEELGLAAFAAIAERLPA